MIYNFPLDIKYVILKITKEKMFLKRK